MHELLPSSQDMDSLPPPNGNYFWQTRVNHEAKNWSDFFFLKLFIIYYLEMDFPGYGFDLGSKAWLVGAEANACLTPD